MIFLVFIINYGNVPGEDMMHSNLSKILRTKEDLAARKRTMFYLLFLFWVLIVHIFIALAWFNYRLIEKKKQIFQEYNAVLAVNQKMEKAPTKKKKKSSKSMPYWLLNDALI